MRKLKITLILFLVLSLCTGQVSALVVNDPINTAVNQLRNAILNAFHVEELRGAFERLVELRKTFNEMIRFNSGIDEIRELFIGNYSKLLFQNSSGSLVSLGYNGISQIQHDFYRLINSLGFEAEYKSLLEAIFGENPNSETKPYITEEDLIAADAYRWSSEVRNIITATRRAAREIEIASKVASPKGSVRLAADALGKILGTQTHIQQNQAKLIELQATRVAQVSREEKYLERERLKFMRELNYLINELTKR